MEKFNLTKSPNSDHKWFSILLLIFCIAILSFLNTQISFSQEDCDDDDDCPKQDEPCCGEDSCLVYDPYIVILVSTTNNVQMRDLNGVYFEKMSPFAGEQYSFMSSTPEGRILFSGFSSGTVCTYDDLTKESGIMRSGYNLPKSIIFDNYWNMYLLNSGKNEILKIDPSGSIVSLYHLKGTANSIAMLPDQCSMLISYNDGSIDKLDLCSERSGTSTFSSGILKNAYTLVVLENGEIIVTDGDNIIRMDINGKPLMTYDFTAHDHWFALTLEPDGKSFWSADYCKSVVWKFDIESGKPISHFNTGTPSGSVLGLLAIQRADPEPEVKLSYAELNLKADIENRSDGDEPITVTLRNSSPPFEAADSQEGILYTDGSCSPLIFTDLIKGRKYYIVINHVNSLEKWSKEPISFDITPVEYDFTTYPEDVIRYGDLNQDGVIDLSDMLLALNTEKESISIDETEDSERSINADETEMSKVYENAKSFVSSEKPSLKSKSNSIFDKVDNTFNSILSMIAKPCGGNDPEAQKK